MTKGQLAMVAVKAEGLRLEAEAIAKGESIMMIEFPRGTAVRLSKLAGVSEMAISRAILIFQYAREMVDRIIAGSEEFMPAHKEAERNRDGLNSAESKNETVTRARSQTGRLGFRKVVNH